MMTDETLERLLIDRSLGALPADVHTLLAAYLESRPDALETAHDLDEIVGTARHVLARGEQAAHPAGLSHLTIPRARTWRVASLAACLAIGVGLGALAARRNDPAAPERMSARPVIDRPVPVVTNELRKFAVARSSEDADAFWSANKLMSGAPRVPARSPAALYWTSPVSSPLRSKGKS